MHRRIVPLAVVRFAVVAQMCFSSFSGALAGPTHVGSAETNRTQDIAELWGYLHLDTDPADYDAMIPMLARTVAPLDANWGPSHVHWAAVNALIKRDLHRDIDASAQRAQIALAGIWQRALERSLSDEDLASLLRFYRSPVGKDYVQFQLSLATIDGSAGSDMLRTLATGHRVANGGSQPREPSPEQIAARRRVQDLSLPLWLAKSEPHAGEGNDLLSRVVVATHGAELDALAAQYRNELGEFDTFNRSVAIGRIAAAAALVTDPWSRDPARKEVQDILAAEPQRHSAEWQAAYAVPPNVSPQLPQPVVKPPQELEPGDARFPEQNRQPAHQLWITGALPSSVPLGDLKVIYATDIATDEKVSGLCQIYDDQSGHPEALEVVRAVPIVRTGDRYSATVVVDRFVPGACNWHLREIRYRLYVEGYGYRYVGFGQGEIQVMDAKHRAALASSGATLYEGQLDIWCGKLLNRNIAPYYPEGCGALDDFRPRLSPAAFASVPALQRDSHRVLYVSPNTTSVRANFHDVDALSASTLPP